MTKVQKDSSDLKKCKLILPKKSLKKVPKKIKARKKYLTQKVAARKL